MTLTLLRYPPKAEDELYEPLVAELEEGWAGEAAASEQWPAEKAMRICPVFRFLTGGH